VRNYIRSNKRFTPKKKPRIITGTGARLWIGEVEISGTFSLVSDFHCEPTDEQRAIFLRPAINAERWHLAWSNPETGEEGRTEGTGWASRESAEESICHAWAPLHPARIWWVVKGGL
jgi:hypothetical protein